MFYPIPQKERDSALSFVRTVIACNKYSDVPLNGKQFGKFLWSMISVEFEKGLKYKYYFKLKKQNGLYVLI